MRDTEENKKILKKLGFKAFKQFEDDKGWYQNDDGWQFRIDKMPSFKVLLKRLLKDAYDEGADSIPMGESDNIY